MTRSEFEHGWTSSGFGTSTEADTLFAALDTDHDGRITASHDLNSRFTALDVNREFLMFFSGFFYLIIFVGVDRWIKGMIVGSNKVYHLASNPLGANIKTV